MDLWRFLTSKDVLLGLIYIGVGVVYAAYTLIELDLGTAVNMGPGYFPMVLSGLIIAIGLAVLIQGLPTWREKPFGPVNWRSVITILVSTIVFAMLARPAGMVIATLATAGLASSASRHATIVSSVVTSVLLAFFCTLIFVYGLGLPLGLLGTWFR
jgi:hypothetical protein